MTDQQQIQQQSSNQHNGNHDFYAIDNNSS